jgi:hypothetical protein
VQAAFCEYRSHLEDDMASEVFVRPSEVPGDLLGGDGSEANPFQSVQAGITKASNDGGGTVYLYGGHFVESVALTDVSGPDEDNPVLVRPVEGSGEVFIDSCLPEFLNSQAVAQWQHVDNVDGAEGEYESVGTYPPDGNDQTGRVNRGAFYDEPVHTRLVSYAELADLRSYNQRWPDNVGNTVWRPKPNEQGIYIPEDRPNKPPRRPFVYMGPGIWFDHMLSRKIHIRLAATTNNIPNWPDYDPAESDPNQLRLALSLEEQRAIFLKRCHHIQFQNLTLRFGNPETVRLNSCSDIGFDHCRIRSGSRAILLLAESGHKNENIRIEHCEVDGGIPTWFFRSDRKDTYLLGPENQPKATEAEVHENLLGYATSGVQLSGDERSTGVIVHHCEIFNAHDSYVFGDGMEFHHNWVHNLNDDGIALSAEAKTTNAKIYCNVITQCLTALSFASNKAVGPVYIYGNLVDIRQPTLGNRPSGNDVGVPDSLRQGQFFKDGADEGPIDLFHNTCLVLDPGAIGDDLGDANKAGFSYYVTIGNGEEPRTAFNNIMVAVFTPGATKPIAFLAPKSFVTETNGNTFFRIPKDDSMVNFRVLRKVKDVTKEEETFVDLDAYRAHYWPDGVGEYERDSTLEDPEDPMFKSFDNVTGMPHTRDDLRLRLHPGSNAKDAAVEMPAELHDLYVEATGTEPADRGCYPSTGARLQVGVDGRRVFPRMRPGPVPGTNPDGDPPIVDGGG